MNIPAQAMHKRLAPKKLKILKVGGGVIEMDLVETLRAHLPAGRT